MTHMHMAALQPFAVKLVQHSDVHLRIIRYSHVTRATSAQKHVVEDDILFTNHLAGKWEIPSVVLTSASYLDGN